jgi:spermidine synthase
MVWNSIMAIAFLLTAMAGVFMALQMSYKWDIPFIKTVLRWHVEFGIGLAVTGIFHFIWHLSYFSKKMPAGISSQKESQFRKMDSAVISTNLFIVGFVSSSIQLLILREIMNIAGGYELITGAFLGSWLIGSASGALIAGKSQLSDIKRINLIFSLSPLISLLLLLFSAKFFLQTGESPSFLISLIYTFIVLIPFCMVTGFTFVKLIIIAGRGNHFMAGKSFMIETSGCVAAGVFIPVMTSGLLNTYQLILLIIVLSVAYALLTFQISGTKTKLLIRLSVALACSAIIIYNPDIIFRQILLPGITVTDTEDTPYGNITHGKYLNEKSLYYNQRLLRHSDDAAEREEDIHYAMLESDSPEKVILISGSLQSHLPEIMKYPVKEVIYIERDPALAAAGMTNYDTIPFGIHIANSDAFRFMRSSSGQSDVIILLVPPPSTLQLNRYFTTEFFRDVKSRLNEGGVFMCSPGPGDDYFNKESLKLYSSIYNSLAAVFKNVRPVVGNKLYFLASDKELSVAFCNLTEAKNIQNVYVSSDFMDDDLINNKSVELVSLMDSGVRQNRTEFPAACFHFQAYNFSKNIDEKVPSIIVLILLFASPVLGVKRRNLVMYFGASALAGFEVVILLTLQLIAGNMYQLSGLIIAGLMIGLAAGAGMNLRLLNNLSFRLKGVILFIFYACFALIYSNILLIKHIVPAVSFIFLASFVPALLTGHIFRELTQKSGSINASPAIYSADLAGSAFGFILISGFAVPAFGIKVSIYILSSLILTGFLFGTIRNKL